MQKKILWIIGIGSILYLTGCTSHQYDMRDAKSAYTAELIADKIGYVNPGWGTAGGTWYRDKFDKVRDAIAPARWREYWRVIDTVETDFFYADGKKVYKRVYRPLTLQEHRDRLDTILKYSGFDKTYRQELIAIITDGWRELDDDYEHAKYYKTLYQHMK